MLIENNYSEYKDLWEHILDPFGSRKVKDPLKETANEVKIEKEVRGKSTALEEEKEEQVDVKQEIEDMNIEKKEEKKSLWLSNEKKNEMRSIIYDELMLSVVRLVQKLNLQYVSVNPNDNRQDNAKPVCFLILQAQLT